MFSNFIIKTLSKLFLYKLIKFKYEILSFIQGFSDTLLVNKNICNHLYKLIFRYTRFSMSHNVFGV